MAFNKDNVHYVEQLPQRQMFELYAEEITNSEKLPMDGTYGIILLSSGNPCFVRKAMSNGPLYSLTRDENGVIKEYTDYPTTEIPFMWAAEHTLAEAVEISNEQNYALQVIGYYCFE